MLRPTLWLRESIDVCRSAVAARLALVGVALLCCTGSAFAGAAVPVIDGNLQDMIDYAGSISVPNQGCAFADEDPARDVRIFDPKIIPCVPVVDNYYVNGFDQILDVLAYDRTAQTLFLGLRVAGVIGDPDGNGDPNTRCPQATFDDETGIGFDDSYKWELNLDCAGAPEITIEVRNNQLTVTGAATGSQTYAFAGSDLEVAIENIVLPPAYAVRVFAGNIADGLGEDLHELLCSPPGPQIAVDKRANPERICPGQNTTFTIVVTNPGLVELQQVNLVDDLPANLSYVPGSASNDCGVGAPNVNGQQITWPVFSLAPGASCTFSFQAQAGEQCLGPQNNVATATGSFATPCFNGGKPSVVQDTDDATVVCAPLPCVDIISLVGPPSACINTNVEITGTVQNCSPEPENIVVSLVGGGSVDLGSIGGGQSVNFSLTGNMGECTAGQNVTFTVNAVATNECGTDDDQAGVQVLCQVPPCVEITALSAPAEACQNTDVLIQGTVQNCGGDPEEVVVSLNGGAPVNLGTLQPGQSVNFQFTANMGACTAGQNVPFTVVATATNPCGTDTDTETVNVLCKVGPCVNITALNAPESVCPNSPIRITGTVENCSLDPETISVSLNGGAAQNLGVVPPGGTANFEFTANSGECTPGQLLPFTVVATAVNDCGETTDSETRNVRCDAPPCIEISAFKLPQSACPNANIQVEISVFNCGTDTEDVVVTLNGEVVGSGGVSGGGTLTITRFVNMGACTSGQGVPFTVVATATNSCGTDEDTETKNVTCLDVPCVELTLQCSPERACAGTPITLSGTVTNCSDNPEDIVVQVGGATFTFTGLGAGAEATFQTGVTMPACTDGQLVEFTATARATNECGEDTDEASCSVECQEPVIDVEKSAEAEVAIGGTIHYTITLTNPSKTVTLENIELCDDLCSAATYADNASPTPTSEPQVGQAGGTICWNVASLAPGASLTFTFEAIAVGGGAECTEDVNCTNTVRATGECGADEATDTDEFTTVIPCEQGLCRFTGGGCLNENGGNRGHKQHTFGGNVSPCPTAPPGPTGDSWEHVVRDGRTILFNFHSWLPCITSCQVVPPGPCSPSAVNTRADFSGPGKYSLGAGSRERDAHFVAYIIDHREGSCNNENRDEYFIRVTDDVTGLVVFEFAQQEIDCGNLQIHETPRRLFGTGPALEPLPVAGELGDVALLGRPYPNPFASSMSFGYEVPSGEALPVEIGIYNVAGRLITRLASDVQGAGRYTVRWDGRDASGVQMAPGVYFLKSRVGQAETVSRLLKVAD